MILVYILFFFSGFAALTYELLWMRHMGLIFGNTVQAAATVMAAYMAGLALGAHLSGKLAERVRRPVRVFGLLEVGIGLYAACMPCLFDLLRVVYRFGYRNISESLAFLTPLRFFLGVLLLLVPTGLMGATLPILAKGLLRNKERFGARLGFLYGLNTFGALAGTAFCGFVLIPALGLTATNWVAVAVSGVTGGMALVLSRAMDGKSGVDDAGPADVKVPRWPATVWLLLIAAGLSGFLALAFEVVWFRALILVFGSTTYSFSAMLSVFLLGIAAGSVCLGWVADKMKRPALLFGAALAGIGLYTVISMPWFNIMPEYLLACLRDRGLTWSNMITAKFAITLIFLFVPTFLFGVAFTACARAVREALPSSPRSVGETYTFNTIGAALGSTVAGFILLPVLGMEKSLLVLSCLAALLGLGVVVVSARRVLVCAAGVAMAVIFVVVTTVIFPCWDKRILASGPYAAPWSIIVDGRVVFRERLRLERLLFYAEGVSSTVSVRKWLDEGMAFCSSGKVEADTTYRSMVLQRMMGHLPMLFHPDPRRVINIGLGAGVTFGALGCYPVEHLEVVEIEPEVKKVASIWAELNHNIMKHPDALFTINDGRNHLFCTSMKYDVITSDPFEPVMAGAGALYTVEHFEQARERLEDDGIMAQYLPLYELSGTDFLTILRSFVKAFPKSVMFYTGGDTILLGFKSDVSLDIEAARKRFAIPAVRESLADIGVSKLEMLFGMFVIDMSRDPSLTQAGILNTDAHPVVEFSAPRSTLRYMTDENQRVLLDHFSDIPDELCRGFTAKEKLLVAASQRSLRTTLRANILRAEGRQEECIRLLRESARSNPDNPVIRNELAESLIGAATAMQDAGKYNEAFLLYQEALQKKPDAFWALHRVVALAMGAGKVEMGKEFLDRGMAAYPDSPLFLAMRGKYRGMTGDLDGACADFERSLAALPYETDTLEEYAFLLLKHGEQEKAMAIIDRVNALRLRR